MASIPAFDRIDYAAGLVAVTLLAVAYGFTADLVVRYAVWLVVFTVWMAWFVYYGTKWMYDVDDLTG
jgi:hypothetical protein